MMLATLNKLTGTKFLDFNIGWEWLRKAILHIFHNSFALIADSHKSGKGSATQFPVIEDGSVVTMSYGCSTFRHEPMLVVRLLWNVLCKIIFSMSASMHSEMKKAVQEVLFVENDEKGALAMLDLKLSWLLCRIKRSSEEILASILKSINEWSEVAERGNPSAEYSSGQWSRKNSRRFARCSVMSETQVGISII